LIRFKFARVFTSHMVHVFKIHIWSLSIQWMFTNFSLIYV
jgi:hypothetical protein